MYSPSLLSVRAIGKTLIIPHSPFLVRSSIADPWVGFPS